MNVLDNFGLENGITVLVCDVFSDDQMTERLRLDDIIIENFSIEPVRGCFSAPKSRHIVVKDKLPKRHYAHAIFE